MATSPAMERSPVLEEVVPAAANEALFTVPTVRVPMDEDGVLSLVPLLDAIVPVQTKATSIMRSCTKKKRSKRTKLLHTPRHM